jgi:DNA-binding NtrC family response regulator
MTRSLRVLLVEDELLIRWSLSEILTDAGHLVVQAEDALGALRELAAADGRFDIVLLDMRLPDCEDFTLLRQIRQRAPAAAIVVMTAYGTPELVAQGLTLGAYAVLDKPFDIGIIESVLLRARGRTTDLPC